MAANYAGHGLISSKILCLSFYLQNEVDPIKNRRANKVFFHYNPMGATFVSVAMEIRLFRSDLDQNLIQPFPYPNDASDKI